MEHIFNSRTNCFEGYEPQYETKINEATGEEEQVLIPCTETLYTDDEVKAYLEQCSKTKALKAVDGKPAIVDRHTSAEAEILNKKSRIKELKALLSHTDYMALKVLEGAMSVEEYEPIRVQRQSWRDEINALEAEVAQ